MINIRNSHTITNIITVVDNETLIAAESVMEKSESVDTLIKERPLMYQIYICQCFSLVMEHVPKGLNPTDLNIDPLTFYTSVFNEKWTPKSPYIAASTKNHYI